MNSESVVFHGNYGSGLQIFSMKVDDAQASRCLLSCSDIDQSNNSRIWLAMGNNQLSEILIKCYKYPAIPMGTIEYLIITRIIRPFSCLNNIMACST